MNTIYKIFSIGFLIFGTASCTDLDLSPSSETTSAVVFDDPDSYRAFAAKLYAGLAVTGQQGPAGDGDIKGIDEGFSNYWRQYWQTQELTTDEAVIGWGDEGLADLHNQNWTAANQFITAVYNRIFFQVSLANEFLRETTTEKLDARRVNANLKAEIMQYRAEARFLRALSYWHGIDLYGNIPLVTEEDEIGITAPDQSTRQEIFNFVEQELLAIESELPAPRQGEYARADQAAVWALLAKLYLNANVYVGQDKYTECIKYCDKIIASGYQLDDEYQNVFLADNHNSPEIIFPITFDGLRTQTWGGMTFMIHASVGGSLDPAAFGINAGWWGLRTTSSLVDQFPDETGEIDQRALFFTEGQSKEINSIPNFTDGYALPKYSNVASDGTPGADLTHPDTDFPMFRLADVYLMYAEAVLRGGAGGSVATAVNYINALRERAYQNTDGNITEATLTLDFVLDERARELYWEGHRRTDLIRFDKFSDSGVWPWKGGVKEGKTTESFRDLFPIPSSEILANSKLDQNEGY